jgi:hypothetical protein
VRGAPSAILWGDSKAAHYIGLVGAFAQAGGFSFRNVATSACPPIFDDPKRFVSQKRADGCVRAMAPMREAVRDFRVVITSASYTGYLLTDDSFIDAYERTLRSLAEDGKLVIIMAEAPVFEVYDRRCREKAIAFPGMNCAPFSGRPDPIGVAANARLQAFAARTAGVEWFDVNPYLCRDGACSPFDADRPLYYDRHHLSMPASWDLGKRIIATEGVPTPFRLIARPAAASVTSD